MSDDKLRLIIAVVERGQADNAVKAALAAGADGATIFFGRGTGVRQRLGVIGLMITPEKEIIHFVTTQESLDPVLDALTKEAKLDEPGRGIAYVLEVARTIGFMK